MSSHGREVELTISSAKNIKNVNWRNGPNKAYAVVWVDPRNKYSTRVDEDGDTSPSWNERLVIPLPPDKNVDDNKLYIDIVHAGHEEDTKPLIGSASLSLRDVLEEAGVGVPFVKTLKLKRPSGRPQGKLDVTLTVQEPHYHPPPRSYHTEPYGAHYAPPQHQYGGPPAGGYTEYEHSSYEHKPEKEKEKEKESKFGGMGTGLAIGAVAGVLGGIALSEGFEAMEDNVAEEAAEQVEDDLAEEGDGSDGGEDSE